MTAESIAQVVADLRAGNVRVMKLAEERLGPLAAKLAKQSADSAPVVDATAIYKSLVAQNKPVYLYEDHPCITPPWPFASICYENEHGNTMVWQITTVPVTPINKNQFNWKPAEPVDRERLRWIVHAFLWIGGRSARGLVPTTGPLHLNQIAIYDNGEPADIHWVHLMPEYPLERWDMAGLVLLGSLNFLNCFSGDTPIITSDGPKAIRELVDQEIQLLSRNPFQHSAAKFTPATVQGFGMQPIIKLSVKRNGILRTYKTTAGHRWFVRSRLQRSKGRSSKIIEKTTEDLEVGDKLVTVRPRSRAETCNIAAIGVCHGLTYGDGTRAKYPSGCNIEIFGDDRYDLLKFFPEPHLDERKKSLYVSHLPRSFKDFPSEDESSPYLYSFLAGWFAADGSVSKTGSVTLYCSEVEDLRWAKRVSLGRLGILTGEPKKVMREGIDGKLSAIWSIRFDRGCLASNFFIRAHHRTQFEARKIKPEPNHWTVVSVRKTTQVEEVFCAIVPGTETFVLDGMILTGNCKNVAIVEPARPRAERKRMARIGVRVHEINVFPPGRAIASVKGEAVGGTPLTSVRGHFARYGAEYNRGLLFGKYSGQYWIQQHARGSADVGEVRSSYKLQPGKIKQ